MYPQNYKGICGKPQCKKEEECLIGEIVRGNPAPQAVFQLWPALLLSRDRPYQSVTAGLPNTVMQFSIMKALPPD